MGRYAEIRIAFYDYMSLPSDPNYQRLEEAKKKFEAEYGADEVKRVLQEAQLAIDREQIKIRSDHLPYAHA